MQSISSLDFNTDFIRGRVLSDLSQMRIMSGFDRNRCLLRWRECEDFEQLEIMVRVLGKLQLGSSWKMVMRLGLEWSDGVSGWSSGKRLCGGD